MKRKNTLMRRWTLPLTLLLIASCTDIPTISIGPTVDMRIEDALNSNNFYNYRLKIEHSKSRYTSASITPNDLLFVVYQDQIFSNEYARYYFDKTGNGQYDVYFYNKEDHNQSNLGYNYYQGFLSANPNPLVLPKEDLSFYFGVFPYSILAAEMFAYRESKTEFGVYDLDLEHEEYILENFFKLDNYQEFTIESFSLEIREKRIYRFRYNIVNQAEESEESVEGKEVIRYANTIDFIYDNLPLETPSSPLINNVQQETIWQEEIEDPEEPPISSEESSPLSESEFSPNDTSTSSESETTSSAEDSSLSTSEENSSETSDDPSSSEPPAILDHYRLNFSLLKDQQRFTGEKPEYPLKNISLYAGKVTDFEAQSPLFTNEDLTLRYFRFNDPLAASARYTIFLELETANPEISEFYFYSFIA